MCVNRSACFGITLLLTMLLPACRQNSPMGPESTLRAYQAAIDRNDFTAAAAFSTAAEQARLEEIAAIIAMEVGDSTKMHTVFERVTCEERGDTARCSCLLADEYERYQAQFILIREGELWLVDAPADSAIFIDPTLEQAIDSLLNALDQ